QSGKTLTKDWLAHAKGWSDKLVGKVMYGLGYSFNLLMVVFVETPWSVIRDATPALIDGKNVAILNRSSVYWKAKGNVAWGDAIRRFRVSIVAMGGFGIVAATLETIDIWDDLTTVNTNQDRIATKIKIASVAMMGLGSTVQLIAGIFPSSFLTVFAMGPWFSVVLLLTGAVYFFAGFESP
ncbi:hypothetical protein ALP45_01684, partial [Pseudomonas coronafaciens pv. atropurpurea]